MAERLKCSEKRKDGEPCNAYAVLGTGKCAGHNHLGVAANPRSNQQRSAEARRAKAIERSKTPADLAAEVLQRDALELLEAAAKAGKEGDIASTRWLFERVLGKPVERVETIQNDLDPASMTSAQRAELRRKLVAENPELLELVPAREAA